MSNDSGNSPNGTTSKTTNELEQLRKEIGDKGYDLDHLAVVMVAAGEQLIGEVVGHLDAGSSTISKDPDPKLLVGVPVQLKNPKRFMRMQKVASDGSRISIDIFVGNLDAIEQDGSLVQAFSVAGYWLKDLGPESQLETLKVLAQYFINRTMSKAMGAGLSLPSSLTGRLGGMGGKG